MLKNLRVRLWKNRIVRLRRRVTRLCQVANSTLLPLLYDLSDRLGRNDDLQRAIAEISAFVQACAEERDTPETLRAIVRLLVIAQVPHETANEIHGILKRLVGAVDGLQNRIVQLEEMVAEAIR